MRRAPFLAAGPVLASGLLPATAPLAAVAGGEPGKGDPRPYEVEDLRVVSGPSPFAVGCPGVFDDLSIAGHKLGPAITAIFTMAAPQAKGGPTDIFFARIEPGR